MEDSDLLQALLQVPPNLKFVQEQLLSGQYSPQQVTELGYHYAEECWNEDLDADDSEFYSEEFEYYWREANTIAGRHSFYLYEVLDLLLKHGLDPNYTVDHDFCLMEFVIGIVNGYIAADTLNLLLESGGNPNLISSGENMFDQICFDVDFDAVEQRDRRRYDSLVHCWMVLLAYGGKTKDEGGTIDVFTEYSDNIKVKFDLKKLKEHRNYYVGVTHGKYLTVNIFDKRTYWEVARY